jgi:PAS domain S-box-containing protein
VKNKSINRIFTANKIILAGLGVGVLYWILESAMHALVFHRGNLVERILAPGLSIILVRLLVVGLLLVLAVYAQFVITERKQAEEALRQEKEFNENIVQTANAVIVTLDVNANITEFNNYAERLTGYSREEVIGQNWIDLFIPSEDREYIHQVFQQVYHGKEFFWGHENPIVCKDGSLKLISWQNSLLKDDEGQTIAVLSIGVDITERKRAEEALRESEERYRRIVETAYEGIWIIDAESKTAFANSRMTEMLGYAADEMIGKPLFDFMDEEWKASAAANVERRRRGVTEQHDFKFRRKDGTELWAIVTTNPLFDEEGQYAGALGMITDITERKQGEVALRESEENFRTLAENAFDGILIAADEGITVYANKRATEITGYSIVDLLKTSIKDLAHPDEFDKILERYRRRLEGKPVPRQYETVIIRKDGKSVPIELAATKTVWQGKPADLVFFRDITERKRAEEALRESEERFRKVFEEGPIGMVLTNRDLKFFSANPAFCQMLGYTAEEMSSKTFLDVTHPAHRDADRANVQKMWQGEIPSYRTEKRYIAKNGDVRWGNLSASLIRGRGGEPLYALAIVEDITERKRVEEARAHGQRTLLALSQAAQAVQRAHTPEEVYCTIGDEVTRLGYNAVIFTLTDDQEHLALRHLTFEPTLVQRVGKLTGLSAQDFRFELSPRGFFQRVITEGEATFRESSLELMTEALPQPLHPLVSRLVAMLGIEQGIVAPLTVGGERLGVLAVTGAGLTETDMPAVTAFANQAAIAIGNARLFEQVQAAREQLRDLAGYLQAAREEERTQMAREIHDEFGQMLSALNMDLSWLSKRLPADQPHLTEKASAMSDLIDSTIQTVRRVATELRPGLLDDLGLAATIEWQAQEFAERTGIACDLYLSDEEIVLERDLATAIFRIFQETLTNVARHASATEVHVELEGRPDELVLIVRDNGKGITESQVSHPRSLGLMGMRERAHSWGGEVAFQGIAGQGTTVTVRIPRAGGN